MDLSISKLWDLIVFGGPTAFPLLIASIVSLAVVIEKFIFFKKNKEKSFYLLREVERYLENGDVMGALNELKGKKGANVKLLITALSHYNEDPHRVREVLQAVGEDEIKKMEKHLAVLDVIAMIAPLLGLLGTVLGIIGSFNILGSVVGAGDPSQISAGIAAALISTAFGLIVAIPSAIFYSYFSNKVEKRAHEMSLGMIDIVDLLSLGE
ncbi:MAG: MotA/TolQ/ExbB proton channel family protein [Candidatus Woesearchaeota archaeon]